eukprot:TRINITY_DN3549_c0_g2_i1.p1 TRINITY_DN3549_c0_g2~~TRINITY_DN3549_c0_g2_i1.p1  ORF type:complete len:2490 (-),score=653.15 TRINITY_DN3549_c0_g2_i1:73-6657(-)
MSAERAKVRFVTNVRNLDCYGINYFPVKERNEKGNRYKKMFLGITKEKILFRNEDNEIYQYFMIEQLARWAPLGNTLTLDFGAYARHYYIFETDEADTIAGIIGGYIDLIHRRMMESTRFGENLDEQFAEEEEIQHDTSMAVTGVIGSYVPGYVSMNSGVNSTMQSGAQFAQMSEVGKKGEVNISSLRGQMGYSSGMPKSHMINVVDMGSALKCTRLLSQELGSSKGRWKTNSDLSSEEWKVRVGDHFNSLSGKVNNLLGQVRANPGGITLNELDLQAKDITIDMIDLSDAVRYVVSGDESQSHLLDGAKAISDTISDMMELLLRVVDDPNSARLQTELEFAEKSILAANLLFQITNSGDLIDKGSEGLIVQCINDVASSMDSLLARVGQVGAKARDEAIRAQIEEEAQKVDGMKDWILSNIEHLIPALLNSDILREVNLSASSLGEASGIIVQISSPHAEDDDIGSLNEAAERVNFAIKNLLLATSTSEKRGLQGQLDIATPTSIFRSGLETINKNISSPEMIVNGVKTSATAHKSVVAVSKRLSDISDSLTSERLLKGAQNLSAAMRDLINSARVLSKNPNDNNLQMTTRTITDQLDGIAMTLLDSAGAMTSLSNLRFAAKATATSILKLGNNTRSVSSEINEGMRESLVDVANDATTKVAELLMALGRAVNDPQNFVTQSELLEVARNQIPLYSVLSSQAKIGAKTILDPNNKQDLNLAAANAAKNLKLLMVSVAEVSDIGGQTEIEEALQDFDAVQIDLDQALYSAQKGLLTPIPGQSRENAIELLNLAAKTLSTAVESLVGTASVGGKIPKFVSESAQGMSQVASAVRAMASTISDKDSQVRLIEAAMALGHGTLNVIADSRTLAIDPKNMVKREVAETTKNKFDNQLSTLIANAYGLDAKELNEAIDAILAEREYLNQATESGISYQEASEALQASGKSLSYALSQLTQVAANNPSSIGPIAKLIGNSSREILQGASIAAGSAPDINTTQSLLDAARSLADSMRDMLSKTKVAAMKRNKNNISKMEKSANIANINIDQLLTALGNATSPEAEDAISSIMEMLALLDSGELDALPLSREQILEEFQQSSQTIAATSASLVSAAHASASKLGMYSINAADIIESLLKTAKSAVLSSEGGAVLSSSTANILKDTDLIINNPRDIKQVLELSKKIIADGLSLISDAKSQASNEGNPEVKETIAKNAQLLVNGVTRLAQATRNAASKKPDAISQLVSCCKSVKSLTKALEESMRSQNNNEEVEVEPALAAKLMDTSRAIAISTTALIRSSSTVSSNPNNERATNELSSNTKNLQSNVQDLVKLLGALNPGIQECDVSIEVLKKASTQLNALTISATVGTLEHVPGNVAVLQEECADVSKQISTDVKALVLGAQSSNTDLFHAARTFQQSIPRLVEIVRTTSESSNNQEEQTELLGFTKNLVDSVIDLFNSIKLLNVKDKNSVTNMAKAAKLSSDCVATLLGKLQSVSSLLADLDNTMTQVQNTVDGIQSGHNGTARSYYAVRGEATDYAKQLASQIGRIQALDKRDLGKVGLLSSQLGNITNQLISAGKEAIDATDESVAKSEMMDSITNIGNTSLQILDLMKGFAQGNDHSSQLSQIANEGNVHVGSFLNATKKGAVGEVMMDKAVEELGEGINVINQNSMFAQAGQLESEEATSKTITQLEGEVSTLASSLANSTSDLTQNSTQGGKLVGQKALNISSVMDQVISTITQVASKIPDVLGQQGILSAGKLLAITSQQLILASKDVQKLPDDPTAAKTLTASQQAVGDAISRLVSVVQDSSAEAARGERELEAAKNKLMELIAGDWGTVNNISGEKIIGMARELLKGTADLVFAGNQEESIRSAQNALNLMANLLAGINSAGINLANTPELAGLLRDAAANLSNAMCDLFDSCKLNRSDPSTQQIIEDASANVSQMMNDLVDVLRRFPGCSLLKLEEDDIESVAELELMKCAQIIAEAANSLLTIKPSRNTGVISQDGINAAIMDAARAIASATGKLIEMAVIAQRERKETTVHLGEKYQNDPTWANGLISAAQAVAGAVQQLVKSCNSAVQGEAEEEALVATARAVASATAHLVSASKAKADPLAPSQRNLSKAAQAVALTTSELVKAAHAAAEFAEESDDDDDLSSYGLAGGRVKQMEQQSKILSLEKMLEDERRRMLNQRKAKYSKARNN